MQGMTDLFHINKTAGADIAFMFWLFSGVRNSNNSSTCSKFERLRNVTRRSSMQETTLAYAVVARRSLALTAVLLT